MDISEWRQREVATKIPLNVGSISQAHDYIQKGDEPATPEGFRKRQTKYEDLWRSEEGELSIMAVITLNIPKSSKSLDDFRIETHGDLGYKYLHFRKPPYMNRFSDHIKVEVSETSVVSVIKLGWFLEGENSRFQKIESLHKSVEIVCAPGHTLS